MSVTQIQSKDEFDQFLKFHKIVIIDASAEGCVPCKAISPIFKKCAAENADDSDKVAFIKFDTDEIPDLAQELGIRSISAFFFSESGELVDRLAGANPPALMKLLRDVIENSTGE